jgi:hypothetical protein
VTQRPSTILIERVRTIAKEIISMSQVYSAHSPAQAIAEAVVIAAALLAAVQAAPVPSTMPSRGIFKAEDAVRRKPWTALAVIAFAALAGAAVFGGGSESRDHTLLVNAALSSAAPASAVEPAIEGAAPAGPAPERLTEADPAPSSESQRVTDATTTTGQSTSTSKDWRKASRERASRDDRRNVTDAYAAQTTKTKKATTVAQTRNAPAPAKDPNCKVFLPDNVFMSHHDQFRCFR